MTDAKPQICYWFLLTGTPQGGAPVEVRVQWAGVAVPVREPRPAEGPTPFTSREIGSPWVRHQIGDGVPVRTDDAVRALHVFGRASASSWWRAYLDLNPTNVRVVFRSHEGRIVPPRYALALFPDLEDFDDH